jgi:uncharacterized membrane protein YsdA (DUF1294 family)
MYIDKKKAKGQKWRVSEFKLFLIASLFGSTGIIIGMRRFRHKTKHAKFVYGVPIIFIIQLYIIYKCIPFMFTI